MISIVTSMRKQMDRQSIDAPDDLHSCLSLSYDLADIFKPAIFLIA